MRWGRREDGETEWSLRQAGRQAVLRLSSDVVLFRNVILLAEATAMNGHRLKRGKLQVNWCANHLAVRQPAATADD